MKKKGSSTPNKQRRPRIKQTDAPSVGLAQALRIPQAIADNYASKPTKPLHVAAALKMQPTSGPFRALCGAAIAYGLTTGGYNADKIELTELGKRILRPTREGDEVLAKREALLTPRVLGEFLRKYDNSPTPKDEIAVNVLEEMSVPRDRGQETLELILEGASSLGLLKTITGRSYVDLSGAPSPSSDSQTPSVPVDGHESQPQNDIARIQEDDQRPPTSQDRADIEARKKRVFIAHGKNTSFLEAMKQLLDYGELEPVVSAERRTVSKPVPDKVLTDMRTCGAAIIHVDEDRVIEDTGGTEHVLVNENVLIEIGAAMALYGRRFVLLVKKGVRLLSNLQGLYEFR
ncbi:MAG: nucleotide-binding protein, partial [Acidobacteria bacterium]|nr:nucleotide-binding protein [Acidobacteriota bacterium]